MDRYEKQFRNLVNNLDSLNSGEKQEIMDAAEKWVEYDVTSTLEEIVDEIQQKM